MLGVKLMAGAVAYTIACVAITAFLEMLSTAYYVATGKGYYGLEIMYLPRLVGVSMFASLVMAGLTVIVSLVVLPVVAALSRTSIGACLSDRPGRAAGGCVATVTIAPLWLVVTLLPTVPRPLLIVQASVMASVAIVISQVAGALASPADVLRASPDRRMSLPYRFGLVQLLAVMTFVAVLAGLAASLSRFGIAVGGLLLLSAIVQASTRRVTLRFTRTLLRRRFERRRFQRLAARST
ncbi:MAG: hypothetical protein AAF266_03330 [Planctomycetota bacterium]